VIFFPVTATANKEGTVGTTKLTRKEILAEDPVHEAIMQLVEFFRVNGKKVGMLAAILVLIALGVYGGFLYLKSREGEAQEQLAKGMAFFHAEVVPDATDDPFGKGPTPAFRSDEAKYKAAAREFSSIASRFGHSKLSTVARYYLGLSQLRLGQSKEAIQNLESVAANSRNRTLGYLAKKVLAEESVKSGNPNGAREILEGMMKDPKFDLPREDLSMQLSRVLVALGKRDEAVKVLQEASSQGPAFSVLKQQLTAELDKLRKASQAGAQQSPKQP
jgi:predicted negative regulator of RcsB-dependent stress response